MDRVHLHMQCSVQHAASMSQMLTLELLQNWGISGFMKHIDKVEKFYRHRRDLIQVERYLFLCLARPSQDVFLLPHIPCTELQGGSILLVMLL